MRGFWKMWLATKLLRPPTVIVGLTTAPESAGGLSRSYICSRAEARATQNQKDSLKEPSCNAGERSSFGSRGDKGKTSSKRLGGCRLEGAVTKELCSGRPELSIHPLHTQRLWPRQGSTSLPSHPCHLHFRVFQVKDQGLEPIT